MLEQDRIILITLNISPFKKCTKVRLFRVSRKLLTRNFRIYLSKGIRFQTIKMKLPPYENGISSTCIWNYTYG